MRSKRTQQAERPAKRGLVAGASERQRRVVGAVTLLPPACRRFGVAGDLEPVRLGKPRWIAGVEAGPVAPYFALTSEPTEFGGGGLLGGRGFLSDTASRRALEPGDLRAGSGYQQRGLSERRGLGDFGGLI